jgi:hypothetical protein
MGERFALVLIGSYQIIKVVFLQDIVDGLFTGVIEKRNRTTRIRFEKCLKGTIQQLRPTIAHEHD